MLRGHGDDMLDDISANFSSNVWHGADNSALYAHLASLLPRIEHYPEITPIQLSKKISLYHQINTNQILITNGATEAIYLIAQAFSKVNTSIIIPSFSEYEDACTLHKHQLHFIDEGELTDIIKFTDHLVFLGNPNNPTGKSYSKKFIQNLLNNNPNSTFIIDEAYTDFIIDDNSMVDTVSIYSNLIIIRSLTKTFCIPGLRLGYIVTNEDNTKKINNCKMPWSVNTLAILAGEFIFDRIANYKIPLQEWLNETVWLMEEINKFSCFQTQKTNTTYFLCKTSKSNASEIKQFLLDNFGILIRNADNFRGLNENYFRINTQSHEKNLALLNALKQWTLLS